MIRRPLFLLGLPAVGHEMLEEDMLVKGQEKTAKSLIGDGVFRRGVADMKSSHQSREENPIFHH